MRHVEASMFGVAAFVAPLVVSTFRRTVVINSIVSLLSVPKRPLTSVRTGAAGAR